MKRVTLTLMVVCLLALGGQSFAELCTIDAVPAATLLLHNFQTDIGDSGDDGADCAGIDTLFSINNASAAPALAHVTLWTDWSWPSIDFDVFLTGFDVQTVSLCNVIGRGNLPVTADEQNDPDDDISPNYGWSYDGSFPFCDDVFPFDNPILTGGLLDRVQNAHAGYEIAALGGCTGEGWNGSGQCSGGSCPEGTIARGYVTVDNVSRCSTVFPSDPSTGGQPDYFVDGGDGVANDINQLWGDWFFVDPVNDFAQGDNLVHIEADPGFNGASTDTGYTFYGRYPTALFGGPFGGADNREPLGTTWAARYFTDATAFNGGTKFVVWRDSTDGFTNNPNEAYSCGICGVNGGFSGSGVTGPADVWCPLNEAQVVCFDEQEDCEELCGGIFGPPVSPPDFDEEICFPLETNNIQVGVDPLNPPFNSGWCYLNLNFDCPNCFPGPFGANANIAQSYVTVNHDALGVFSVGYPAIELTNACQDVSPILIEY